MLINNHRKSKMLANCALGGGVTSLIGTVFYEYYHLKHTLNSLMNTNVLDIDKKRPDYIYIKYSVYRESMAKIRSKSEYNKNWVNIIVNPFGKWWKSIKHSVAWRLLEIAKTDDQHDRWKAVQQLSQIDHLKDWDYQHLAQLCDARTAISLARLNCDSRWFLPCYAKGAVRQPKSIIVEIRDHIEFLKPTCKCVNHFYSTAFNKFNILKGYTDNRELQPFGKDRITRQDLDCLKQSLEVMFHLTKDPATAKHLIERGFLQTLIEIQKLFHYNTEMRFMLSKVLANMSMCTEFIYDFFVTGWVGILAGWAKNPDLRVQVTAAKALANLDVDDTNRFVYQPRIYPLYPRLRSRHKPDVDIVFVHGLLGGVFVTWRQKDRVEPQLGLYGKNAFYYTKDSEDDMFMADEFKVGPTNTNKNGKTQTTQSTSNKTEVIIPSKGQPLINTKSKAKKKTWLSDVPTNELIATLETAEEMKPDWEVVFPDCPIHSKDDSKGLYSCSGEKWVNDDKNDEYTYCWPMDWLPSDFPNIRVIGLNYETSLSEWSSSNNNTCPCEKKGTLHNRSEELLQNLVASGVGANNRPVIWVGHSMGGLIAKSIIIQALESSDEATKKLAENTRAILFLGTPHKGSAVAKLKQHIQLILSPTVEVKELEENGTYLLKLHEKFLKYMDNVKEKVEIVSVAEGCPTVLTAFKFPFHIVTAESAKLQFGDFYILNVDHLGLSKPIFRQSFLYQRLVTIIDDVLTRAMEVPPTEEEDLQTSFARENEPEDA